MSLHERVRANCEAAPWVVEAIKALETERDALAAYVERLSGLIDDLLDGEPLDELNRDMNGLFSPIREATDMAWLRKVGGRLRAERNSPPETSLTRLKAQWQAEALEGLATKIPGSIDHEGCDFGCGKVAAEMAAKLRHQAEGQSHD